MLELPRLLPGILVAVAVGLPPVPSRAQTAASWSGSGVWSDPTHWTTNPLYPCNGNGGLTFDATILSGTATLDLDCAVQAFTLTAGGRDGAFTLDVNQLFTWSNGTLGGSGATHAHGGVLLSGSTHFLADTHTLELSTGGWTAGQITMSTGAPTLHNPVGSTWTASGVARSMIDTADTGSFLNDGVFTVAMASPATILTLSPGTVTNTNLIHVSSGILSLNTNASYSGSFDGADTLRIQGGTQSLLSGSSLTTANLEVSGGTLSQQPGATVGVSGLTISSGRFDVVDAATTASTGSLTMTAGARGGSGTLASSGLFTWNGGTLDGAGTTQTNGGVLLGGSTHFLADTHTLELSTGSWTASQITMSAGAPTLHNPVGSTWTASGAARSMIDTSDTGSFLNDGVFTVAMASPAAILTLSPGTVTNTNLIRVSSGILSLNTNSSYSGSFDGADTLRIQAGTQSLLSGSSLTTANLEVTGATFSQLPGATVGVGSLTISSGRFDVVDAATTASTGTFTMTAGARGGAGTLASSGLFTWNGGTLDGAGTTQTNGGALLAASTHFLADTHTLVLSTGGWTAGQITMSAGAPTLHNPVGSTWTASGAQRSMIDTADTGSFLNDGVFTVAMGSPTTILTLSPGTVTNSGTIDVATGRLALSTSYTQTAGSTRLSGGSLSSGTPLAIQGGVLEGNGTVTGSVVCAGAVSPGLSAGQLEIDGALTLQPGGELRVEIGGLSQGVSYDFLSVTGAVTLGGTLSPSFLSGFESTIGNADQVTVLESNLGAPLAGSFSNVANGDRVVTTPDFGSFKVSYGAAGPLGANRVVLYDYLPYVPEISFHVLGSAQGGTITLDVEGVQIVVNTTPGQSASQVAAAIALAINGNAALAALGIVASVSGSDVAINGGVRSVPVVSDPGLSLSSSPSIPALPAIAGLALAALLGLVVAIRVARA